MLLYAIRPSFLTLDEDFFELVIDFCQRKKTSEELHIDHKTQLFAGVSKYIIQGIILCMLSYYLFLASYVFITGSISSINALKHLFPP